MRLLPVSTLSFENSDINKQIKLGPGALSGLIKGDAVSADLAMTLTEQDYLRGALAMDLGKAQTLSSQVSASIRNFTWLEALVPQLSGLKGQLSLAMTAKGALDKPLVNGGLQLSNGEAVVDNLGINLREVNLTGQTSNDHSGLIQINGSAKSGDGLIQLKGTAGLAPETQFPIELALAGKNFEVAKIPAAQIAVSPDLKFVKTNGNNRISGQIDVPKAILAIQEIPENAVRVSEDEIILGEEKTARNAAPSAIMNAGIEVVLGDRVSFSGQGLKTNLSGRLKIVKTSDKLALQGNVAMAKASYNRFGQDLTVRKGRFLFNGPVDNPWLDVEVIRRSKNKKVTAIVALSGTLKNPQPRISSEPALPESEALAYLVTGNSLSQVSKAESNMLASAALSYGAGKAAWLTEKLSIDEFKVEEGNTLSDSLLVMGEYLTPDFYVGPKVGMFNKQANIVLKHKITDTINVETQADTSQRIKLNYEFDSD